MMGKNMKKSKNQSFLIEEHMVLVFIKEKLLQLDAKMSMNLIAA